MNLSSLFTITNVLIITGAAGLTAQAFIGLSFFISCIWEREKRATVFALLQFLGMLALLLAFLFVAWIGFFGTRWGFSLLVGGHVVAALAAFLLLLNIGKNPKALEGTRGLIQGKVAKHDERDIIFARNRALRPGSKEYKAYYAKHPEKEEFDTKRRARGGPIGIPGKIDSPNSDANVAMTMASLNIPHYLSAPDMIRPKPHFALKEKLKDKKVPISPQEASLRIKGFAKSVGADMVGITKIDPLWVYSHRGEIFNENWEDWGQDINMTHQYGVVLAEEMALDMIGSAPHTPTVIESMKDYAKGAVISTQIASMIANLGYFATANHLRHYECILPPLAVDAGLGEVGRCGYLMTKEFGARIRLSLVTTDLELVPDKPVDIGVEHFCIICKKCAHCCPSQAIPEEDDPMEVNGSLRWKLNEEACFDYWGKVGTDCNVCMNVCPWSHARTFPHRLIVAMISRNSLARYIFQILDDVFYGKKPKPKAAPKWAQFTSWDPPIGRTNKR
jgi:reductive dehalogenase